MSVRDPDFSGHDCDSIASGPADNDVGDSNQGKGDEEGEQDLTVLSCGAESCGAAQSEALVPSEPAASADEPHAAGNVIFLQRDAIASPSGSQLAPAPLSPSVSVARSPSGPHGEPCLTSYRLWSFFFSTGARWPAPSRPANLA
jgi:hypothetical protein